MNAPIKPAVDVVILNYRNRGLMALMDLTDFMMTMPDEILSPDIDTATSDKVARAYCPIHEDRHCSSPVYPQTRYLEHLRGDIIVLWEAHQKLHNGEIRYIENKTILVSLFSIADSCEHLFDSVLSLGVFESNRSEPYVPIISAITQECAKTIRRYKEKLFSLRNEEPGLRDLRNKVGAHSDSNIPLSQSRDMMRRLAGVDLTPYVEVVTRLYNYLYFLPIHAWESVDNDGRRRATFQNGLIAGRILVRYPVGDPESLTGPETISIHKLSQDEMNKTILTDKQKNEITRCWADPHPDGEGRYRPIQKLVEVARARGNA